MAPEATPNANAKGSATAATVIPAKRSFWNVRALYPWNSFRQILTSLSPERFVFNHVPLSCLAYVVWLLRVYHSLHYILLSARHYAQVRLGPIHIFIFGAITLSTRTVDDVKEWREPRRVNSFYDATKRGKRYSPAILILLVKNMENTCWLRCILLCLLYTTGVMVFRRRETSVWEHKGNAFIRNEKWSVSHIISQITCCKADVQRIWGAMSCSKR